MKKFLLIFMIFAAIPVFAEDVDHEEIYRNLEVPTHRYIHNIDPGEYSELDKTTWTPYPLFRLTSPLHFKSITIEPGYYLLTPREHQGNWYILFKEAGQIKYIIPAYNREVVPMNFYEDNLPKAKLHWTQRWQLNMYDFIGKHFENSQRKPIPNTYLETTDLDNNFISMVIYWGNYRYYTIFRTIKL